MSNIEANKEVIKRTIALQRNLDNRISNFMEEVAMRHIVTKSMVDSFEESLRYVLSDLPAIKAAAAEDDEDDRS